MAKKPTKKPRATIDTKRVFEQLKVELTFEEKIRLGARASQLYARLYDVEDQLKAHQAEKKAEIKRLTSDIDEALQATYSGYELRTVPVLIEVHWQQGLLRKIRSDTGVCYFERTLTTDERQRSMFNDIVNAASDELKEEDETKKPTDDNKKKED
jgi:hypothetical protein